MTSDKKIYFASDFHLGVPDRTSSLEREKKIVRWLEEIRKDAAELYLMGDVFDFWFEYGSAVPNGYVRLLGKLAELSDAGVKIHWFTGNHDMWIFRYIPSEIGCTIYRKPVQRELNGKKFFLGHGDGLGPGDQGYKFIKKVFASKVCQWLFARLHPNCGLRLGNYLSRRSRISTAGADEKYLGDEKEFLVRFCKDTLQREHFDYFIFGHRHLPLDKEIGATSRYINLGEWVNYSTYAVFDGERCELKKFDK
ncbi:MAG: UDP-2,3-diacylglucosamine diphosphatase [Bacteroidia bacterium]|nr:UDP-2,3-diacylglucosamine diphosphatase [Bacteroidia bacterium]